MNPELQKYLDIIRNTERIWLDGPMAAGLIELVSIAQRVIRETTHGDSPVDLALALLAMHDKLNELDRIMDAIELKKLGPAAGSA